MSDDITGKDKEVPEAQEFQMTNQHDIPEVDWIPESLDALIQRMSDKLIAYHMRDVTFVDGNPDMLRAAVMVRSLVSEQMNVIRPNLSALWNGFSHFQARAAELSRSEMIGDAELPKDCVGKSFGQSFVDTVFPVEASEGVEMLSIPKRDIRRLAAEYLAWLEVTPTNKLCQCVKSMHPEDSDKPEGTRRYRVVDPLDTCVLHSPEGKITGFFEFVFSAESEEDIK